MSTTRFVARRRFAAATLGLLLGLGSSATAQAPANPRLVPFQGRLTDAQGVPRDGEFDLTFAIYDAATGGEPLWSERHVGVGISGGLINVLLGSLTSLDDPNGLPPVTFDQLRFLGITVGGTPAEPGREMVPRHQLVPAFHSRSADIATTVPDESITEEKLADESVTADKLAVDALRIERIAGSVNLSVPALQITNSGSGTALVGYTVAGSDGVIGQSDAAGGRGVRGITTSASGQGVVGINVSPGTNVSYTQTTGVFGYTDRSNGIGVFGRSPLYIGVHGESFTGVAVRGDSVHSRGVYGLTEDGEAGVYGFAQASGHGVYGETAGSGFNAGVKGVGPTIGVSGQSQFYGVHGRGFVAGVFGTGDLSGAGVVGQSDAPRDIPDLFAGSNGAGVYARASNRDGIALRAVREATFSNAPVMDAWAVFPPDDRRRVLVLDAAGNLVIRGDFFNRGLDIAEQVGFSEAVAPGAVVEIDPENGGTFRLASTAYSPLVAGIVSTAPGVTLGAGMDASSGPRRPALALAGRVPTKVTAMNGAIRIGDLLTTSSVAGHAMRCEDRLRCVGAVVGKALEPFEAGKGVIQALITLQ